MSLCRGHPSLLYRKMRRHVQTKDLFKQLNQKSLLQCFPQEIPVDSKKVVRQFCEIFRIIIFFKYYHGTLFFNIFFIFIVFKNLFSKLG